MLERARFLWERLWNSHGQNQGVTEVGVAANLDRRNLGANLDGRSFCRARAVLYLPRAATSVPLPSEIQWEGKHPRGSPDACLALIQLITNDHSVIRLNNILLYGYASLFIQQLMDTELFLPLIIINNAITFYVDLFHFFGGHRLTV